MCDNNVFDGLPSEAIVYVDKFSVDAYKEAKGWKNFTILPMPDSELNLIDGDEFNNSMEKDVDKITYTRTFPNDTWQSLYIPFSMQYEDWADNFEMAYLSSAKEKNGELILSFTKLGKGDGTITANTPYLIRAKHPGECQITVNDAILYAATSNSTVIESENTRFTLTGTYQPVTDMFTKGHYAMAKDGGLKRVSSDAVTLKPYRWYLDVTDKQTGDKVILSRISVMFEDEETVINDLQITDYELQPKDGKYINDGNLIIIIKNGIKYNINGIKL